VRDALLMGGYTVLEAANGEDALRVCAETTGSIHLVLTDVVMPHLGGRALAERLAARHPEIKILYMSGYTDDAVVRHGVLEAHHEFLQKPFAMDTLLRKVHEVLHRK
jgi:two-component system, cell cycle sensor histidine kinase and response regulator CckA